MNHQLIEQIYEAALVPDMWPVVLESLGNEFGSRGGLLFASSEQGVRWLGGGDVTDVMRDFLAGGWMAHNPRPALGIAMKHPGFLNELDYMTEAETIEPPMFKEFLRPRGFFATAGTWVQGLSGDQLILSLEGFKSHHEARASIPELDQLRPHLARSVQLAGQFRLERMQGYVEAMEALGAAACVLGGKGTLRVANQKFQSELGALFSDVGVRIHLSDSRADALMLATLRDIATGHSTGRSIAMRDSARRPRVLHIVPVRGRANDLFVDGEAMLVLTNPHDATLGISHDVLADLFDLTAAEAKVAAMVCQGAKTLQGVADELGVTVNTVKSHLQAVFDKTGTNRQLDLARLLIATRAL